MQLTHVGLLGTEGFLRYDTLSGKPVKVLVKLG